MRFISFLISVGISVFLLIDFLVTQDLYSLIIVVVFIPFDVFSYINYRKLKSFFINLQKNYVVIYGANANLNHFSFFGRLKKNIEETAIYYDQVASYTSKEDFNALVETKGGRFAAIEVTFNDDKAPQVIFLENFKKEVQYKIYEVFDNQVRASQA